jgi:hypothetical protein
MIHQKLYSIAPLSTTKAFIDILGRGNCEGRGLLIVKWAQPDHVYPSSLKVHIILYHLLYFGGFNYFLYTFFRNQELKLNFLFKKIDL